MLVFQPGESAGLSRLVWYGRSGKEVQQVGEPALFYSPRLSHDGRRLAVDKSDTSNNGDIWIYDLSRNVSSRLTYDPADESDPIWSPDDTRIVFFSALKGLGDLYQRVLSGRAQDELLLASTARKEPIDWSQDGRYVLFHAYDPRAAKTNMDLWFFSLPDRKAWAWLQTRFHEFGGQFSPDGKWIAYVGSESGRLEIYIQSFPQPGSKTQISTAGGSMPAWRGDGKELFYISSDQKLMSVSIRMVPKFETGLPEPLFEVRVRHGEYRQYDVSEDGERFLLNETIADSGKMPITLVQNWPERVKR
jgi:Tol biopolymer transport system component